MAMMTRRRALSLAAGPFFHAVRAADVRRPNFLFLLTDDQSYATLSSTGSPFMRTPNIDRLAREGATFTNCFVAMSLCAPSRAAFLTGNYPHTNGIYRNQIRWNQSLPTLPRALQAAGYRTAHIGKWHMDGDDRVQPGYDYWAAQVGQGQYVNPRKNINGKWVDLQGYDTQIITDQAIEFMRSQRGEQPFCVWIGFKACHGPFTPAPGHENDFANVEFKPPASYFVDDTGKPERVRRKARGTNERAEKKARQRGKKAAAGGRLSLERWAARERDQYRCLMGVEDAVGRLLGFLDEQKLADETIVYYAGDNGFFHGEHGLHGKTEAYEEALRVPAFVRYPRLVKGGQRVDRFIANIDLAPTILDFCGVKQPGRMQGRSWRPLVTGQAGSVRWRDAFLYEMWEARAQSPETPTVKALRTDRHKLILNLDPKEFPELYDLKSDPQEMKNLAQEKGNRELMQNLKRRMLALMRETEDPAIPAVEAYAL
jgi:N-acetylglucosamine-6-sulfatase